MSLYFLPYLGYPQQAGAGQDLCAAQNSNDTCSPFPKSTDLHFLIGNRSKCNKRHRLRSNLFEVILLIAFSVSFLSPPRKPLLALLVSCETLYLFTLPAFQDMVAKTGTTFESGLSAKKWRCVKYKDPFLGTIFFQARHQLPGSRNPGSHGVEKSY